MEDYSQIQKPDPGYRYAFGLNELDAMSGCLDAHGFAIIQDVLPPERVESLQEPENGKRFLAALPGHLKRYTHGYTSIDTSWRG